MWEWDGGTEMSVPLRMASAAAKHLTMLSAYFITAATSKPPQLLSSTTTHTTPSKPCSMVRVGVRVRVRVRVTVGVGVRVRVRVRVTVGVGVRVRVRARVDLQHPVVAQLRGVLREHARRREGQREHAQLDVAQPKPRLPRVGVVTR